MKVDACIAVNLDDEQRGYSGRDGVIGHLGVQMSMGNKGELISICFYEVVRRRRL